MKDETVAAFDRLLDDEALVAPHPRGLVFDPAPARDDLASVRRFEVERRALARAAGSTK